MKKLSALLILISLSVFFIFSCKKNETTTSPDDFSGSSSFRTTVCGIVLDESNAAVSGVTVTAYAQTVTTDSHGIFVLKNLAANKDRCVLKFTKTGFFNRTQGFIASENTVNYVRIILLSNTAAQNFPSSVGGLISLPDGSSAEFQPNSFVTSNGSAYTGTVNLVVKHLSPDDANFGFMIPGGDLLGKDLNNKDVALYTYGMVGVELTGSSGEPLQLATGTHATLTFAIAASQLSSAPASIPLWYFDETTSLWKEEGAANKVGNNYVGTVKHFSWWNCDISASSPLIKGKVIDCQGNPVPNCVVTVNGWATTITNQNGEYQGQVPAGLALTVQVLGNINGGIFNNSQLENVSPLSNNQTFIVPNLVIDCPARIIGILENCNGENVDGLVGLTFNGFYVNYYIEGNFNINAPPNSNIHFTATDGNFSYDKDITTLGSGVANNLNAIKLCDTIDFSFLPDNCVYVYNSTCQNDTLILLDSTYISYGNSGIFISYYSNTFGHFYIYIDNANLGDHNWFHNINTRINSFFFYWGTLTSSQYVPGNINLIEVGPVNGRIKGTFIGKVWLDHTNGMPDCWAYIKGKFDVKRTH